MTDVERGEFLKLLTKIYYQLDDHAKVIEHGTKALEMTGDPDLPLYLGQAYYLTQGLPEQPQGHGRRGGQARRAGQAAG